MALRIKLERTEGAAPSVRRRRGWTVAAATVVAGVLVTGVSYAFWTATGSGSATVASVTAQALSVTSSSPVVSDLYPGKATEALTFVITNPNPYAVNVTSAALGTATSSDATNCPTTNLTVLAGPYALNLVAPANGSVNGSIANFLQMKSTAGNLCQGITFTFPLTISGTQQ
jgi:hypothetical protein